MRRNHRPKRGHTLHLSTLVHQVLSIIAGRGGATASTLLDILCAHGPFQAVDRPLSVRILRYLGDPDRQLLEQAPDGVLLLGEQRERVVAHFRFFAVFQTPDEFRVIAEGRTLGPLPVTFMLMEDMAIIFAGQRWRVLEVDDRARTITVTPEHRGIPPIFGESGGELHARVVQTMLDIYQSLDMPRYLDETARTLLREGREEFTRLDSGPVAAATPRNRDCPAFPLVRYGDHGSPEGPGLAGYGQSPHRRGSRGQSRPGTAGPESPGTQAPALCP